MKRRRTPQNWSPFDRAKRAALQTSACSASTWGACRTPSFSCRTSRWTRPPTSRSAFGLQQQQHMSGSSTKGWGVEEEQFINHLSLGDVDVWRRILGCGYQAFIWADCTPLVILCLIVAARAIFLLYCLPCLVARLILQRSRKEVCKATEVPSQLAS